MRNTNPFTLLILITLCLTTYQESSSHDPDTHDESSILFVRTQSIYPPYIDHEMANRWYDFGGATIVNTNQYIRLTPDFEGRKGWLRSKTRFYADSWSVEFEYKIHGKNSKSGDGLAFWFTDQHLSTMTGKFLGGPDQWNGLAVAIDTYDNGGHGHIYPYVAAFYNDGTKTYNKASDGKELELGGCEADVRNQMDYLTRARIRYIKNKYLKVDLNTREWGQWTTCVHITTNLTLPSAGFIGFTGETGGLSDNHDIISVTTNQILRDNLESNKNPPKPKVNENYDDNFQPIPDNEYKGGPSFLKLTLFFLVLAIAVYFVGLYLGMFGQARRARDLKHF